MGRSKGADRLRVLRTSVYMEPHSRRTFKEVSTIRQRLMQRALTQAVPVGISSIPLTCAFGTLSSASKTPTRGRGMPWWPTVQIHIGMADAEIF